MKPIPDPHYDIAVIGAGPAGSMAARHAAGLGRRVCLFERNARAGFPVRCGEGIGHKSFIAHVGSRMEWTKNKITRSAMVSPSGTRVTLGDIGENFILDREKMDNDLAAEAAQAGADLFLSTPIVDLRRIDNGYECRSPDRLWRASIVIIADGVESRAARFLGWDTTLNPADIEPCAFCRVTSASIDQKTCVFYVGSAVAPGGYAWIFPRGGREANVGCGVIGTRSGPGKAKEYLLRFLDKELPGATIKDLHCGGVPVGRYVRPLVRGGAMLVGDAARQVNCISGAGIHYSLFAGKCAGETAAQAFRPGAPINYRHLLRYEAGWIKTYGKQQERSYALKEFVMKTDDAFLDRIAASLAKELPERMNYLRVFARTFSRRPLLLLKAVRLFG